VSKAFLDTTILVDGLLKRGEPRTKALAALRRYDFAEFPIYAIKEFKAGALYNWVWLYNKLKDTGSHAKTLAAIKAVMAYKKNRAATALEGLAELERGQRATFGDLQAEYGKQADPDSVAAERLRLAARVRIFTAWRKRNSLGTPVVPLPCYMEKDPYEGRDGLLSCSPMVCDDKPECSMAPALRARNADLVKLREAVSKQPSKAENTRRSRALKELIRNRPLTDSLCRSLGDAVFALFAPADAVVLTTNIGDHQPLAEALGKRVEAP
jgi:hypothetical protein